MFIKTVSTTSGINPIKFDETGGVFYWILNTGSSTIYASTKSVFTAGDDGVVSLGPKESRRLETNNDTIYILGAGQVEIHNQRDGICSFKQAPTYSGSGGGDIGLLELLAVTTGYSTGTISDTETQVLSEEVQ